MKRLALIAAALVAALVAAVTPANLAAAAPHSSSPGRSVASAASATWTPPTTLSVEFRLTALGYVVKVDGVPDARTTRAVQKFQRASGLRPDGVVGPITDSALDDAVATLRGPAAATSPADRLDPQPAAPVFGGGDCSVMNAWAAAFGLPFDAVPGAGASGAGGFDDQPRLGSGAPSFASQGIGFREGGCDNSAGNSCCVGAWGFNVGNLTASGYGPIIRAQCGQLNRSMIQGNSPDEWRASACVTKVLYDWFIDHGGKWPWRL